MPLRAGLVVLSLALPVRASEHNHVHGYSAGAANYEWAGLFAVSEDNYVWTAQKSATTNTYADAHMKMAVLSASAGTDAAFDALKGEGNHSLTFACTEVEAGGVIVPVEDACYELHFDTRLWQSLFLLNLTGTSHVAIFTQHACAPHSSNPPCPRVPVLLITVAIQKWHCCHQLSSAVLLRARACVSRACILRWAARRSLNETRTT